MPRKLIKHSYYYVWVNHRAATLRSICGPCPLPFFSLALFSSHQELSMLVSANQNADRNENNKGQVHMVSDEDSFEDWTRVHLCYILAKNLTIFCSYPETLQKTEFKGRGLIDLVKDISSQPHIQAVVRYCWLGLVRFI